MSKSNQTEKAAPGDNASYLYKPPKPSAPRGGLKPIRPPGTYWKTGHVRFDNAKRDWTAVGGHWAKKPNRRLPLAISRDESADDCRTSPLLAEAEVILQRAFCSREDSNGSDDETGDQRQTDTARPTTITGTKK
jgi:hypothetical protein